MRLSAEQVIARYDRMMNGYYVLLDVRYRNLCPKADALSLLNVKVTVNGIAHNIEDVAQTAECEWNQLLVMPFDHRRLSDILEGIMKVHPDFTPSIHSIDGSKRMESQALLFTMQKVDGKRRDVLNEAVKALYDECALILKQKYQTGQAELDLLYADAEFTQDEMDETNLRYDQTYNTYADKINSTLEEKLKDIEYAYQQYLLEEQESAPITQSEAEDLDAAMTMEF